MWSQPTSSLTLQCSTVFGSLITTGTSSFIEQSWHLVQEQHSGFGARQTPFRFHLCPLLTVEFWLIYARSLFSAPSLPLRVTGKLGGSSKSVQWRVEAQSFLTPTARLYTEACTSFLSWNWVFFVTGMNVQIICLFWRPSSLSFIKDPARGTGSAVSSCLPTQPGLSLPVCTVVFSTGDPVGHGLSSATFPASVLPAGP